MRSKEVELWYPGTDGPESVDEIVISLMHVRAAEDLIVRYDFDRDGWQLLMIPNENVEADPVEVGFVYAWAACSEV